MEEHLLGLLDRSGSVGEVLGTTQKSAEKGLVGMKSF